MTTQTFTDGVTLTAASWFSDVDTVTYSGLTTVAGTANAITAVGPASATAYAARQRFHFIPASTNTASTTINITCNSVALGAKSVFKNGVALVGGEIRKNIPCTVEYDGTQFHILDNAYTPVMRSYLSSLTLSTAGSSATMSIAAGQATDSGNAVSMALASSISKTTSAWAVGSGNGGLDTGAIANSTWYHFYLIMRDDTNVVDVLISLSASSPTMPTNYSYKRRIGSGLINGSGQWTAFTQDGDYFQWLAANLETTSANPGTSAVTQSLATPLGVNVKALLNVSVSGSFMAYLSDLSINDVAPSSSGTPLASTGGPTAPQFMNQVRVRTNTSSQIRTRISASGGGQQLFIATYGWEDTRGKDI